MSKCKFELCWQTVTKKFNIISYLKHILQASALVWWYYWVLHRCVFMSACTIWIQVRDTWNNVEYSFSGCCCWYFSHGNYSFHIIHSVQRSVFKSYFPFLIIPKSQNSQPLVTHGEYAFGRIGCRCVSAGIQPTLRLHFLLMRTQITGHQQWITPWSWHDTDWQWSWLDTTLIKSHWSLKKSYSKAKTFFCVCVCGGDFCVRS